MTQTESVNLFRLLRNMNQYDHPRVISLDGNGHLQTARLLAARELDPSYHGETINPVFEYDLLQKQEKFEVIRRAIQRSPNVREGEETSPPIIEEVFPTEIDEEPDDAGWADDEDEDEVDDETVPAEF